MKKLLPILLLLSIPFHGSPSPLEARWGYVYHHAPWTQKEYTSGLRRYRTLALTGYELTGSGHLRNPSTDTVLTLQRLYREGRIDLVPVIRPLSVQAAERFLSDEISRAQAAENCATLARDHKFNEIHFDFEYLSPQWADEYAAFLTAVKKAAPDRLISAALFPKVDFPDALHGFHRPDILAPILDRIVLMCYDYHNARGLPGPVTSLEWAERNIQHILTFFPPSKVILGIPAYGYVWKSGRGQALSAKRCLKLQGAQRRHESGTLYVQSGHSLEGWCADSTTRRMMQSLARRYGLAGTAVWRVGFEE